jgi:transcriptional regulator with XRE-family HTH domain
MNPVGRTIRFWRMKNGLTQAAVARQSGVSRPNLSAIEQGARDLTVQTLRRIASTLGVTPGALVDGVSHEPMKPPVKLDRYSLDRIARIAAGQSLKASDAQKRIARDLASIMKSKTRNLSQKKKVNNIRSEDSAILRLKTEMGPAVFQHLIRRVEKNLSNNYE